MVSFLSRDESFDCKPGKNILKFRVFTNQQSPGQLCASSRGKTEGASVKYDDWA